MVDGQISSPTSPSDDVDRPFVSPQSMRRAARLVQGSPFPFGLHQTASPSGLVDEEAVSSLGRSAGARRLIRPFPTGPIEIDTRRQPSLSKVGSPPLDHGLQTIMSEVHDHAGTTNNGLLMHSRASCLSKSAGLLIFHQQNSKAFMLEQSEMMPTNTTTRIFTEEKIAASTTKSHIAKPRQRAQSNPVRASRFSTKARSFSVAKEGQTEEINELPKRMSTALEEEGSCFGRVSKLFNFRRRSSSVSKAQQTLPDEVFSFSTEKSSKSSIKVYQGESIVPDDRTIPYVSRVNSRRRSKTESCISNSLTAAGGVSKSSLHLHHCPSVLERTGSTHAFSHDHEAGTLRSLPHPIPRSTSFRDSDGHDNLKAYFSSLRASNIIHPVDHPNFLGTESSDDTPEVCAPKTVGDHTTRSSRRSSFSEDAPFDPNDDPIFPRESQRRRRKSRPLIPPHIMKNGFLSSAPTPSNTSTSGQLPSENSAESVVGEMLFPTWPRAPRTRSTSGPPIFNGWESRTSMTDHHDDIEGAQIQTDGMEAEEACKEETHTVKSGAPTFWDCLWVIWKSARAAKKLAENQRVATAACQPNNASTNGVSIDTFSAHASHIQRTRSFHASVVLCDIHGAHVVEETYQVKDVRVVDRPSLPSNSTSFSLLMKLPDHTADTQRKNVSSLEVSQSKSHPIDIKYATIPRVHRRPSETYRNAFSFTPPHHPDIDGGPSIASTLGSPSSSQLNPHKPLREASCTCMKTSGSNSALHPRTMSMRGLPASSPSLAKLPVTCSLAPTASASTVLGCRCRWCFGGVGVEKIVWGDNDDGHDVDNVIRLGGLET